MDDWNFESIFIIFIHFRENKSLDKIFKPYYQQARIYCLWISLTLSDSDLGISIPLIGKLSIPVKPVDSQTVLFHWILDVPGLPHALEH